MNPTASEFIPRDFYTSVQSKKTFDPSRGHILGSVPHSSSMDLTPAPFLNLTPEIPTSSNPITENLLKMAFLYNEFDDCEKKSCSNYSSSGYETCSPFLTNPNSPSPIRINLRRLSNFDRKDKEDFELEEMRKMLSKPKKSVREDYICHICHLQGDHIIQQCPKKDHQNELRGANTPYQGSKMCLGQFMCPKCKRKWSSTKSEAGIGQDCTKCKINTLPYKQMSLSVASNKGLIIGFDPQFPHLCRVKNSTSCAYFPVIEHWN